MEQISEGEEIKRPPKRKESKRYDHFDTAEYGYRNEEGAKLYAKEWYGKIDGEWVNLVIKWVKPNGNRVTVDSAKDMDEAKNIIEDRKEEIL